MITKLLLAIFSIIIKIMGYFIGLIISLFSVLIPNNLLLTSLTAINSFYVSILPALLWVIDSTCVPNACVDMLVAYFIWKISLYLVIHPISFVIHWYNKIKP